MHKGFVMSEPDMKQVVPVEEMRGDCEEDTTLLKEMLEQATNYLKSHKWCPEIEEKYFGFGVGGIVAVFLFKFNKKIEGTDDFLWVVVGDLPLAYFVVDSANNPKEALEAYCELMEDWAAAVTNGTSLDEVYPVNVPPTSEYAKMLSSRICFIREEIIPEYGKSY